MNRSIDLDEYEHTSRVFLWCTPRSLSTCLTKCISFIEGMQTWFEPYTSCYENSTLRNPMFQPGNHKMSAYRKRYYEHWKLWDDSVGCLEQMENLYEEEKFTYPWVKHQLENTKAKYVFVKDLTYAIEGVPIAEYYPDAHFQETFLIRHPRKVFTSFKTAVCNEFGESQPNVGNSDIINDFPIYRPQHFYGQLYERWQSAKSTTGKVPVVIDVDQLLMDPEGILRQYFKEIGFLWNKSLLSWDPSPKVITRWHSPHRKMLTANENIWLKKAVQSSCFLTEQHQESNIKNLMDSKEKSSRDIEICVNESFRFYNEMRKLALK